MKVAVYIGINELPLNKVQKAAVKLMQCDLKFLYTILTNSKSLQVLKS